MTPAPFILLLSFVSLGLHFSSAGEGTQSKLLPAPSISVRPSERVSLGGNAIISCRTDSNPGFVFSGTFYLEKDGPNVIMSQTTPQTMVTFSIMNVRREYGGTYSCYYVDSSSQSNHSKPLELLIIDPELPGPKLSLSPYRMLPKGSNVTIRCCVKSMIKGPRKFYLHVVGDTMSISSQLMEPDGDAAKILITSLGRKDGGNYSCSYRPQSEFFISSEASDNMELLVIYPGLRKPNISLSPSRIALLGSNITIQCLVKDKGKRFYLHQPGDLMTSQLVEPGGDRAVFPINNVGQEHGGSYHCSYNPTSFFISSETSHDVQLLVLDPSLPRPNIFLEPKEGVPLGGTITIRCESQDSAVEFSLQKDGQQVPRQVTETNGAKTKFTITNASWEHGGSYSCSYSFKPFVLSEPSSPSELLIIDPALPRPNISLSVHGMLSFGSNTTIQCWVKGPSYMFYLHKDKDRMKPQLVEPDGDMATFPINNVSGDDGGKYRCSYRLKSGLFTSSETSHDVEMLAFDPNLTRPTISMSPSEWAALGGQVSIQCKINNGPAKFFLRKDGNSKPKWLMASDWDVGDHFISNISWEHQGNYSCSYALDERPFVFSVPSDPLELLVSDYAPINITRFALGGLLLLILTFIVILGQCSWKEHELKVPRPLPEKRHRHRFIAEYSWMTRYATFGNHFGQENTPSSHSGSTSRYKIP